MENNNENNNENNLENEKYLNNENNENNEIVNNFTEECTKEDINKYTGENEVNEKNIIENQKIEIIDKDILNDKIKKITKKVRGLRIANVILSVFLLLFILLFIGIGYIVYYVAKNNNTLLYALLNNRKMVASVSQIQHKDKIDMQKFTNKLAFIDDAVNILYYYDKDNQKIEDAMFSGYLSALGDRYAEYFPAKDFAEFTEKTTEGVYYGIGCVVSQDRKSKQNVINNVYENSPADIGGLKKDDVFISVDDENVEGWSLDDLVNKIKGPEGTKRIIEVYRPSINEHYVATCYCGKVDIKLVNKDIYEENIGYIDIDEFTGKVESQFKSAVDDLMSQDIKALILDCRGNVGGELMTVLAMIDYLIKDKDGKWTLNQKEDVFEQGKTLLVYIKEKEQIVDAAYAEDKHSVEIPMIVLTDVITASAAELFTETLRDYDKAEVVGIKSFGKGVVQNVIPYEDGSAIKFTVSEYFPASGYGIDQKGIIPDYSLDYAGREVYYDDEYHIIEYDGDEKIVFDREGNIIEEVKLSKATDSNVNISTNSNVVISTESIIQNATISKVKNVEVEEITDEKKEQHIENLKIYDEENKFLEEDWFVELDDKYDDKQLLQAIILLKDKLGELPN